eukprot:TRINITY_DN6186_c0_g1_i1.p1 TRINITY_DN6186_c0_g1~~TRINITY_DN6186_c0_g1_i1.p1  ORF type:complete len:524 (+),score=77.40 TRINITY_DN6186_c0_g1_i1:54-1574(+)
MEYCEGGDLHDYIIKHSCLSLPEAFHKFRQILTALAYCHEHFVVHRDIKPENILLAKDGTIKIGDFGFARSFNMDTIMETSCGSLAYAAPEVILGKGYVGPKADVWSSGCVLYAMITGNFPFGGDTSSVHKIKVGLFDDHPNIRDGHVQELLITLLNPESMARPDLKDLLRHPWVWMDRPLLAMLVRPFADEIVSRKTEWTATKMREKRRKKRPFSLSDYSSSSEGLLLPILMDNSTSKILQEAPLPSSRSKSPKKNRRRSTGSCSSKKDILEISANKQRSLSEKDNERADGGGSIIAPKNKKSSDHLGHNGLSGLGKRKKPKSKKKKSLKAKKIDGLADTQKSLGKSSKGSRKKKSPKTKKTDILQDTQKSPSRKDRKKRSMSPKKDAGDFIDPQQIGSSRLRKRRSLSEKSSRRRAKKFSNGDVIDPQNRRQRRTSPEVEVGDHLEKRKRSLSDRDDAAKKARSYPKKTGKRRKKRSHHRNCDSQPSRTLVQFSPSHMKRTSLG